MEINIITGEELATIYLDGDFVQTTIANFENTVRTLFSKLVIETDDTPLPVLFELSNVHFISSAGIAALVGIHMDSRHRLIEIGFCALRRRVLEAIQRTKIDQMLTIFKDEETGREYLIERRRMTQRYTYESSAILKMENHQHLVRCMNISSGGCSLYSETPFTVTSRLSHLQLTELKIEAMIIIRRCTPLPEGGYEIATAFCEYDVDRDNIISDLIRNLNEL
ncbi:MAG: STAS domain-containing protein [SAR324 cluster bacterium]|nr:STAS domain-containing protein [SAR324 cluster bacterium]